MLTRSWASGQHCGVNRSSSVGSPPSNQDPGPDAHPQHAGITPTFSQRIHFRPLLHQINIYELYRPSSVPLTLLWSSAVLFHRDLRKPGLPSFVTAENSNRGALLITLPIALMEGTRGPQNRAGLIRPDSQVSLSPGNLRCWCRHIALPWPTGSRTNLCHVP
ncbi:hypothetical protein GJAV_G00036660 [Gymnothorax javanicus]|nr:hypothetical protein GJAV_G00036660 [Gymnothorax javanicus]